jgi:hypothetical protein
VQVLSSGRMSSVRLSLQVGLNLVVKPVTATADLCSAMTSNARCVDSGSGDHVLRVPTASESMAWCVDSF